MSDNRIVPRYTANIVMGKPTVAKVLDNDDYVDHQMVKNHDRAVASQISTEVRLDNVQQIIGRLAVSADHSVKQLHSQVTSGTDKLDRSKDKRDDAVIDFGEQALSIVSDVLLKMLVASGQYLTTQAGDDIRDNIKESPPPVEEKPQTIIYQQPAAPKMRPAKMLEGGRTKYVFDD